MAIDPLDSDAKEAKSRAEQALRSQRQNQSKRVAAAIEGTKPIEEKIPVGAVIVAPSGGDYKSIQKAVDAAEEGETILVYNGHYRENVVITKRLTLKGIDGPVVDALQNEFAILLRSNDTVAEGFVAINSTEAGIELRNVHNCTVKDNNASCNEFSGIIVLSSSNNTLINNTARDNYIGIIIEESQFNSILENDASFNKDGISISDSDNNSITNNTAQNNFGDGIYISGNHNKIAGNNASSNHYGIKLDFCYGCTIQKNIANVNLKTGIDLVRNSYNNLLEENWIQNNKETGIFLEELCSSNTLTRNVMNGNLYNLAIKDPDIFRDSPNYIDASNSVEGRHVFFLVGRSNLSIDETSRAGVIYCLDCKNITLRNLTLNNNYHGIYLLNTTNSRIENNKIQENHYGIAVDRDSHVTMQNNNLSNNYYNLKAHGIHKIDSSNMINGKPIYYLLNRSDLILDGSSHAAMVYCYGCNNITLRDLRLEKNYYGVLFENTTNSRIDNCSTRRNYVGLYLLSSRNNSLNRNEVLTNKGAGLHLEKSDNNSIQANRIDGNGNDGITLDRSNGNELSSNEVKYNLWNGIHLFKSDDNKLLDNIANSNLYCGIHLYGSNRSIITNNTAEDNDIMGIKLEISYENFISNNTASDNNEDGFYLGDSKYNSLLSNMAADNEGNGINAMDSENNTFAGNWLKGNAVFDARDNGSNNWDDGATGNYYQSNNWTDSQSDGICDAAYLIPGGDNLDRYPLSSKSLGQ